MSTNLATRLREGTQQAHTLAENTAFMKCFLAGKITKEPFRKLLGNLYLIYTTLETHLEQYSDHSALRFIYFPELNRQTALEQDLAFYYGENWQEESIISEAGAAYVQHVNDLAKYDPIRLIAHSYVRYLGDLSGGQGLKIIVRSTLDLPPQQGTSFYEFGSFATPEAIREFKIKYRDALNTISLDENTIQNIVDEANYVFMLNRNLLQSLEKDISVEFRSDLLTFQI